MMFYMKVTNSSSFKYILKNKQINSTFSNLKRIFHEFPSYKHMQYGLTSTSHVDPLER